MSGSGSTQLAALQTNRNGYGTELSEYFSQIAKNRLNEYLEPSQTIMFPENKKEVCFKILNKDIRKIKKNDFPTIDYIITSPPYWDMLNMKGAENQARRKEKGLKLNYSDSNKDLGNITDYEEFIDSLIEIYFTIIEYLKPGGYVTIIVKNIKKKGKNYPFAWDLSRRLSEKLILFPEFYWLQDDINLAPYGYGNTFVSNTFHQYCLNFKKPEQ
jgi:DNA modification methylase